MTTRRRAFGVAGAAAFPVALAACGPEGAAGGPAAGQSQKRPVKLSYWNKFTDTSAVAEDEVVKAFQQKFPYVTVEALEAAQIAGEGSADREKFVAALAAGAPPEVIKIDRFKMGGHGAKRTTTLLDDLVKRDKIDLGRFWPATVEEIRFPPGAGGKVTALPWDTDNRVLFYNTRHFQEAGLDPAKPPRTWEDAADSGLKLTKRQGSDLVRLGFNAERDYTNWSIGWHWAAGGQWLKPGPDGKANRRAAFNDERARRWMQYLVDNRDRLAGGEAAYQAWKGRWGPREQGAIYNDGLSMFVNGTWNLGDFKKYGATEYLAAAPPPRPAGLEGTPVTWAGGFALAIPTGIKGDAFDAAWEFVKYYTATKEAQLTLATISGRIPVLVEAAEDKAYKDSNPLVPVFVEVMKHAKIRDVTPAGDEVWFNNQTQERPYALFDLRLRALEGKESPADILDKGEKHVNQVLDEAWAQVGQ
jgi:multiple sugar transport system substrate-binding protein